MEEIIYDLLESIDFPMNYSGGHHIVEILRIMREVRNAYVDFRNVDNQQLFEKACSYYDGKFIPPAKYGYGGKDKDWLHKIDVATRAYSEDFRPEGTNDRRLTKYLPDNFMESFEFDSPNNFENINLTCIIFNMFMVENPHIFVL